MVTAKSEDFLVNFGVHDAPSGKIQVVHN